MSVMKKTFTALFLLATSLTAVAQAEQNNYMTPNMEMAYQSYQSRDYQTAYDYAYAEYMSNPKNPLAYLIMADIQFFKADNNCSAFIILDEGIANINPTDSVMLSKLHSTKGNYYHAISLPDKAPEEFYKALEYTPYDYNIYYHLMKADEATYDYEGVVQNSEICLSNPDIDENSRSTHYLALGMAYYELKEYDKSIEYLDKFMDIDKENTYSYIYKALSFKETGRHEEAIESLIEVSKIKMYYWKEYLTTLPTGDFLDMAIAKYKEEGERNDKEYWDRIIVDTYTYNLRFTDAYEYFINNCQWRDTLHYVELLSQCGPSMQDKALQYLDEYNDDDSHAFTNCIRSQIYLNIGRYQEALNEMNIFIKREYDMSNSFMIRGYINECLGNYDAAIDDYSLALFFGEEKVFYFLRGLLHQRMGDTANAEIDFNLILDTPCESDSDYRAVAFTQAHLGNTDKAIEAANKIEDIPIIDKHIFLAAVYALSGNAEESMQHITWATENGFRHFDLFSYDPFFKTIRGSEQLQSLITAYDK